MFFKKNKRKLDAVYTLMCFRLMKRWIITCLFLLAVNAYGSSFEPIDTSLSKTRFTKKIPQQIIIPVEMAKDCAKIEAVAEIISEAIAVGAPTYNEGNHIGCYRIYEGAAYKILHKYGTKCKNVKNTLEIALEKSYGDYSVTDKAWIMRMAFDQILGVPTVTK